MSTTNQDPFIAHVLIIHTLVYERIKYLLCQGLYTTNLYSLLNKQGIKVGNITIIKHVNNKLS